MVRAPICVKRQKIPGRRFVHRARSDRMNIAVTPPHLGRQLRVFLLGAHDVWPFRDLADRNSGPGSLAGEHPTAGSDCGGAAGLGGDPGARRGAVIGRCLDALFTGFLEGELDVVVVCNGCTDETAALARSSRLTRSGWRAAVGVQARRAAGRGRGGEGIPAAVPGRRRRAARVGGPRRAGATAVRGARRPTADPIRQRAARRRRCAATTAPDRGFRPSWVRSGVPASTGSLQPAGADSALSRTWSPTTSGWTGCSTRARWRSSTARRSWSRCRAAVAIFCGSSVVPIGARGRRRLAPDLRDRAPETVVSTLRDLGRRCRWSARPRRSTRRRTPPSRRGAARTGSSSQGRCLACRRAVGAGRQLEGG